MLSIANCQRSFPPHQGRHGVSLLEVLISIFVLMVGLLGVAALIPVGRHHIAEGIKADRAAACGQAVLHDAKIRGWINPLNWRDSAGNPIIKNTDGTNVTTIDPRTRYLLPCRTYAIDPLFIAYAKAQTPVIPNPQNFPYGSSNMTRVTVADVPATNGLPVARRLCTWNDDLLFAQSSDDPDGRPRALVLADPSSPSVVLWSNGATVLRNENQGDYTWLLTVTPIGQIHSGNLYTDEPLSYQVSVVVFQKRDLAASEWSDPGVVAPERVASSLSGGGAGGGDVVLGDPDVKTTDWVMVGASGHPYQWYRVVAAEEEGAATRYVTLAGPDWPNYAAQAAVFSDVAGVFTATVPSERKD